MVDLPLLLGTAGAACILSGFLLVQRHAWSPDSLRYDVLNLIGSSLLLVYGWIGEAWPFVVLNGVWAAYSLRDIAVDLGGTRSKPAPRTRSR